MRNTGFFFDERCLWHTSGIYAGNMLAGGWVQPPAAGGHVESPETKRRFKNLLEVSGLAAQLSWRSALPVSHEDLLRVHSADYLQRFQALSDGGGGQLAEDSWVGPGSYDIARLSAGLACAAVDAVLRGELDNAYALSRPPGHHCLADRPLGFCFLANIAIAINQAQARHGVKRVAVIDWDVHHGNGTQAAFYARDDVLTVSLHQDRCFPAGYSGEDDRGEGAGRGCNLNIPLLAGAGHESYLYALERLVLPAVQAFKPDLMLVACGYDASGLDPLARMQLHSDSYRAMTDAVLAAADTLCGGRVVMVHEGGYSEHYVPFCGLAVIESLSGRRTAVVDPMLEEIKRQQPREPFVRFQQQALDEMGRRWQR